MRVSLLGHGLVRISPSLSENGLRRDHFYQGLDRGGSISLGLTQDVLSLHRGISPRALYLQPGSRSLHVTRGILVPSPCLSSMH